ncbi:hypothetical protein GT022_13095 [Agaribacter marinus]|uniref:Uncharacterized protein n=1 Tax=Virgibacillus salarius TaxID=447199 RepID=A0A941IC34_9BACI|nr:hypothetical protein [Virgibacillus salarius]MBR7796982.1 hypothetical protein [Virgibacillus salarius]NAZ09692.1 hypothetical protein [Agaribacter marinus]
MSISKWMQEEGVSSAEALLETLIAKNNDIVREIEGDYRNMPDMKQLKLQEVKETKEKIKEVSKFMNEKDKQADKPLTEVYGLSDKPENITKSKLEELLYKLSDKEADSVSFRNLANGSEMNVVGGTISYNIKTEGIVSIGEHSNISTDDVDRFYALINYQTITIGIEDNYMNLWEITFLAED